MWGSLKAVILSMYFPAVHMRERQELKGKVHQLEDELASAQKRSGQLEGELASAQRQSRVALARAVRAEIEADKVQVLEQQLQQTQTDLEEQIRMKDQAIAAEQQLQQTKATLVHELHMKDQAEQQFNEATAGLQHALLLKDQAIATYQQQIHQMRESLEHQTEVNKQAMVSAQQQFSHHVKVLEHQIEVTKQARLDLEMQIQAKDREKAMLEQQLCQKEEQIQTKERELEQQLQQRKEHGPPVAEMQQEESVHVIAQGEVPIVHQLLQTREEVRTKEEELRQVREVHETQLSRLTHESTAKQQEIELELKAQMRTKSEEINVLQSQADAIQCDQDDLQQQLKAKDLQITAISTELQHKEHKIETLTVKCNEMMAQINSLDAKLTKVEFLEGVSSQEVDQLREELMDKEVEIDYLRKEQIYITPTTTATSSSLCT